MIGIRCARCGKIHFTDDTMQKVVSYNGKKLVLVCRDDRLCTERRGKVINHKSIGTYHDLSKATAIQFAIGIDEQNHKAAYVAQKAREQRARNKAYMQRLVREVTNVQADCQMGR